MPIRPSYRLLEAFEQLFRSKVYRHRASTQCDAVALQLYEDLYQLGKSSLLKRRISSAEWVVNTGNKRHGVRARRGDGTFGEKIPGDEAIAAQGFIVQRGRLATVEIGVEMKVISKAMIKQVDRVISDLTRQLAQFKRGSDRPISVAIVGVNHAEQYTSYEGDRPFQTDGSSSYRHPVQEAAQAERRLLAEVADSFDHFLVLRFRAPNVEPFPFEWLDADAVTRDYGAILTRISREYDRRFRNGNGSTQS